MRCMYQYNSLVILSPVENKNMILSFHKENNDYVSSVDYSAFCLIHFSGSESNAIFVSSQDAFRNGLVATEVMMWFYIGECIGKGGIIGYDV